MPSSTTFVLIVSLIFSCFWCLTGLEKNSFVSMGLKKIEENFKKGGKSYRNGTYLKNFPFFKEILSYVLKSHRV